MAAEDERCRPGPRTPAWPPGGRKWSVQDLGGYFQVKNLQKNEIKKVTTV